MSDPRNEKGPYAGPTANVVGRSSKPTYPSPEVHAASASKGTTTAHSAFGVAKRGVKSTRTATGWTKDSAEPQPHRSQTMPIPPADSYRPTPTSNATLPDAPAARPRRPSPKLGNEGNNDLDGSGYEVERLPTSALKGERSNPNQWLAPSMPLPDIRQSGSSFQTEPSSYYSADDNWSTSAAPPPMPVPNAARQESADNPYESAWLPAQPSSTLEVDASPPRLPSPYEDEEEEEQEEEEEEEEDAKEDESTFIPADQQWTPNAPLGVPYDGDKSQRQLPPSFPSHDRYDSMRLASAPPGKPSAVSPPLPVPSSGQMNQPFLDARSQPGFPQHGDETTNTGSSISSTAPLRVHHYNRPTTTSPTSPTSPYAGRVSSRPNTQAPGGQRPPGPIPTPNSSNLSQKPTSIYPQENARRAEAQSHPNSSGPAPQFNPFYSANPSVNRPEARPSGTPAASTSPPNVTSVYQPHRVDSHQSAATPPGAAASAFSSSVAPRPIIPQNPQSITRPQGYEAETPRPQRANGGPLRPNVRPQVSETTSPRPQNTLSGPQKPTPATITQQANARPQNNPTFQPHQQQASPLVVETPRPHPVAAAAPKPQQRPSVSAASKPAEKPKPQKMTGATPTRRHGELSQMDTQYVNMMLALDDIPTVHNIAAGFFCWILLAGFILFPGTFSSLKNLNVAPTQVTAKLIHAVTNLPLFIVAWVCCAVGAAGMSWLWWRWRKNYLWAVNKIFLPGLMNSLAGFISTVANIYGVQHGEFSTTSKSTIIVTGASMAIFGVMFLFYTFWLVRRVKAKHDAEVGKQKAGKYGEGVVDLSKRKT